MPKRLPLLPHRWRLLVVTLLLLVHAIPLILAANLILPKDQGVMKDLSLDPDLYFLQADSVLSVEKVSSDTITPPLYKVRVDSISQTNKPTLFRQDHILLFQDGVLVSKSIQNEDNVDTVIQKTETSAKYNHLYQVISFHFAKTHDQQYQQTMSSDYLYVSATKYGGIQSFHQPETLQHRNWKEIIDRGIHHQMNYEWKEAFHDFQINPNDYYIFPLSQMPIYSKQEELPGISAEVAPVVIRNIWNALFEHLFTESERNPLGSSMPLILISKDGTTFRVIYRSSGGLYHELNQSISVELK